MYNTISMQEKISKLYAHIFILLEDIMRWYLKRRISRLLDSFKDNIYEDYQDQIDNIVSMSINIKREAELGRGAEVRTTRFSAQNTEAMVQSLLSEFTDIRYGLEERARRNAENRYILNQWLRDKELDRQARQNLEEQESFRTGRLASGIMAALSGKQFLMSVAQDSFDSQNPQRVGLGKKHEVFLVKSCC